MSTLPIAASTLATTARATGAPLSSWSHAVRCPSAAVSFASLFRPEPVVGLRATASRPSEKANQQAPARRERPNDAEDALDPLHRRRAALAPPEWLPVPHATADALPPPIAAHAAVPRSAPAASLEELIPTLVRRIAWSGDRHRGAVWLELGAGELAGATLLVHADGGRVRVEMNAPPGTDTAVWQQRISQRIAARGIAIDWVEVT